MRNVSMLTHLLCGTAVSISTSSYSMEPSLSYLAETQSAERFGQYLSTSVQDSGILPWRKGKDVSHLIIVSPDELSEVFKTNTDVKDRRKTHGYVRVKGNAPQVNKYYVARFKEDPNQPVFPSSFMAMLRSKLPQGTYRLSSSHVSQTDLLAWAMTGYTYQYSKSQYMPLKPLPSLIIPRRQKDLCAEITKWAEVTKKFRDGIRTRTNQFMPTIGMMLMYDLGEKYAAKVHTKMGKKLIQDFEYVYEVGKGSKDVPNVTILKWKPADGKYVIAVDLVGKGVCFDTGGNNIKTDPSMMYADKGGALAHMALAEMIMAMNLPIKLRLGNAWVVNSAGGMATNTNDIYKIGDLTVENKNTDAEGRLIMAPILAYFAKNNPAKITQTQATLTGGAMAALGIETAAAYMPDDIAPLFMASMRAAEDPVWQLPRDKRFLAALKQTDADLANMGGPYGGSITADQFLCQFASPETIFIHMDTACAIKGSTGITPGVTSGDMFGVRGTFEFLKRYLKLYEPR